MSHEGKHLGFRDESSEWKRQREAEAVGPPGGGCLDVIAGEEWTRPCNSTPNCFAHLLKGSIQALDPSRWERHGSTPPRHRLGVIT